MKEIILNILFNNKMIIQNFVGTRDERIGGCLVVVG